MQSLYKQGKGLMLRQIKRGECKFKLQLFKRKWLGSVQKNDLQFSI